MTSYIMKTTGIPVTELIDYLTDVIGIKDSTALNDMKDYEDIYYVYWTTDKTFMHYRYTEYNSEDDYKLHQRILEGRVLLEYNGSFIGVLK